jgi:hypothetical protein
VLFVTVVTGALRNLGRAGAGSGNGPPYDVSPETTSVFVKKRRAGCLQRYVCCLASLVTRLRFRKYSVFSRPSAWISADPWISAATGSVSGRLRLEISPQ